MLSQFVVRFFSLSVALTDKPSDGVLDAQCGMLSVTGSRNSSPTGPHITNGLSIFSPVEENFSLVSNRFQIIDQRTCCVQIC